MDNHFMYSFHERMRILFMHEKFLPLIKQCNDELHKYSSTFNIIGYAKLSMVAFLMLAIYLVFRNNFALGYVLLLICAFIVSVALWVYHSQLSSKINYIKGHIAIYNRQISRINGQWVNFKDIGAEFIDTHHPYSSDLDIVGKKSLFQFLNTTHTWHGRHAFANDLLRPTYGSDELKSRQEAIAELSRDIEFSSKIQYHLSKIGIDSAMPSFIECIKNNSAFIQSKTYQFMLTYTPALTLILIAGIVIFQQSQLYIAIVIIAAVQFLIWAYGASKARKYLSPIAKLPYKLSTYSKIIDILTEQNFTAHKLTHIQKQLNNAKEAIKNLSSVADKVSIQHNVILYFLANIFLLWDYYCAFSLQDWKQKYAHMSEEWFLAIGEFESMLSLSHLPNVCNNTSLPVIDKETRSISAKSMGHPLLPNKDRINNDFCFNNNIHIVSGSNMSGKTTFLRTIGINIILARTGGFVCAGEMRLAVLGVATSMRLADDLNEGVSTFYAELKRIKAVIELIQSQPNTVFLIDEIFRGTNSIDRLAGAKGVISKLDSLNAIGLLSTHDLELCELESLHSRIRNYSFSEHYKNNKLCFDYKLKSGKSNTTNAKYLMQMIGIVD